MKKLILLPLMLATVLASAQLIKMAVPGGTFGRQNKTFDLNDVRDFPTFNIHGYYDTVIYSPLTSVQMRGNVRAWLAKNFTSLPAVLVLDEPGNLVLHPTYDEHTFSLEYKIKDAGKGDSVKVVLSDFKYTSGYALPYYFNRYTANDYKGGKRAKYNSKKFDLIHLQEFANLVNWLRINCIPAIGKAATF